MAVTSHICLHWLSRVRKYFTFLNFSFLCWRIKRLACSVGNLLPSPLTLRLAPRGLRFETIFLTCAVTNIKGRLEACPRKEEVRGRLVLGG